MLSPQENNWFSKLNYLTEKEYENYINSRQKQIESLKKVGLKLAFTSNKIYTGSLSKGCEICGNGDWSCLFINGLCTADCSFCPQDREQRIERDPFTENLPMPDARLYAQYVKENKYSGVSFSGGEPLMVLDKVIERIKCLKEQSIPQLYLWMYTNGDLASKENLRLLKEEGLNEIRFNIAAQNYKLDKLKIAQGIFDTLTVEIPALPGDESKVISCLNEMVALGVKHLNLHQLYATDKNYNKLDPSLHFINVSNTLNPCVESEQMVLNIIQYVLENKIDLSVNYCAQSYKSRLQQIGLDRHNHLPIVKKYQDITDTGLIRNNVIQSSIEEIKKIISILEKEKLNNDLWKLKEDKTLEINSEALEILEKIPIDISFEYSRMIKTISIPFVSYCGMEHLEYKKGIVYKSPVLKAFRGFDPQTQDINVLQNIAACEFTAPEYN